MFVELDVFGSTSKVLINLDAISQVAIVDGHVSVHRVDGGSVQVYQTYEEIRKWLDPHHIEG